MDRLEAHRKFYADLVTSSSGVTDKRIIDAFASTSRENFVGPGPWKVLTPVGHTETPTADPAFLYQDVLVALDESSSINNGQPSLHALCLASLKLSEGESVVHVGTGTGYYTAMLAQLVGSAGSVTGYEIDADLARRAAENLTAFTNVTVEHRSGSEPPLPACDALYVNAGATAPLDVWLDALRPGGRLLFPLTPAEGFGGMLLITRLPNAQFKARFLSRVMFIPCLGARDDATARKLAGVFKRDDLEKVRSLHRRTPPDKSCWFAGNDWWLSAAPPKPTSA